MSLKSDPSGWKDPRHRLGVWGERVALEYLKCSGWRILHHRFRMGRLEIDVVARRDSLVAFIEVKTRLGVAFGSPLEAVTAAKQREIVRVASFWLHHFGRPGDDYRFDVIGVTLRPGRGPRMEHVEDAFRPGWR